MLVKRRCAKETPCQAHTRRRRLVAWLPVIAWAGLIFAYDGEWLVMDVHDLARVPSTDRGSTHGAPHTSRSRDASVVLSLRLPSGGLSRPPSSAVRQASHLAAGKGGRAATVPNSRLSGTYAPPSRFGDGKPA